MNDLHPAWYAHRPGEEISNLSIVDSFNNCLRQIYALGILIIETKERNMPDNVLPGIGDMIVNTAEEAQYLIDQWHKQPSNVTQLKQGNNKVIE